MAGFVSSVLALLPRGDRLPAHRWAIRHLVLTSFAAAHAPVFFAWALVEGYAAPHALLEAAPIALLSALAAWPRLAHRAREVATALAMLTASAVLVHLMNGAVEGHFHFFLVVALLGLYEQWLPFLVAIGYVGLHHLAASPLLGIAPINHAGALEHPGRWAAIHAAFIAGQAAIVLASWKLNEDARAEITRAEQRARWQAEHDPLTGLPSRALLLATIERGAHRHHDAGGSLLLLDLDDFKLVNDSLGHDAGDQLLQATAERLSAAYARISAERFDGAGMLGRLGGDEFVLVTPAADEPTAGAIADELLAALGEPVVVAGAPLEVSATIGITVVPPRAERRGKAVLADTTAALEYARREHKGGYAFFGESMRRRAAEQLQIERSIRHAVERGELHLVYQPQYALSDGHIHGVEALLRWTHPDLGFVSPADFIPIAERNGAIIEIGAWVLDEACRQAAEWGVPRLEVSVNVSSRQLTAPGFVGTVRDALARHAIVPSQLCLEVTETAVLGDPDATRRVLGELTALGVQLAVDDFGVGFASLAHLRQLMPVDVLKIDKSFIDGVLEDPEDGAIVAGVIRLAHSLGLQVVAEGVEHAGQGDLLRSWDCEYGQGYHYARPLPPAEVGELLGLDADPTPAVLA